MGIAAWGPTLGDGTRAVTLYLEADLGVVSSQYQPNAVGVGTVGSLTVQAGPTWTDITHRLVGMSIEARFERSTQGFSGWELNATLRNDDGALSIHNSQSPYYLAGIGSTIRAGMPVRCRATYNNGSTVREWSLFTGRMEAWDSNYAASGYDPTVKLHAVDDFIGLADYDSYEQSPAGSGEGTGARLNRILDNAGHTGMRSIATGKFTVQATTLAQAALTELKLTADSEGGFLYSDGDGRIIFHDRDALATLDQATEVQATFADDGSTGSIHYLADGVQPRYDRRLVVTDVARACVGGTLQTVSSSQARAQQRRRVMDRRTDLVCESDAQALQVAQRTLALRKEVRERIDSLTVNPDAQFTDGVVDTAAQTEAWEALSSRRVGLLNLVRTVYTPIQPMEQPLLTEDGQPILTEAGVPLLTDVGSGTVDAFSELQHIQGIAHRITPNDWLFDLSFSSAEVWYGASQSRVGLGRVGSLVVWTA